MLKEYSLQAICLYDISVSTEANAGGASIGTSSGLQPARKSPALCRGASDRSMRGDVVHKNRYLPRH